MNKSDRRRIGVNLLWLVPGEVGGSEEYSVRLLSAFADSGFDDIEVILYVNQRFVGSYPDLMDRFTTRVAPISGSSRLLRVLVESTWLAARSRMDHCDVLHHAGGTMPTFRSVPGVITMHDLQPLANPERFGLIKGTYIRVIAPRSVRKAERVLCLSEFVANDVVTRVGIDRSLLRIVPCGVSDPGAAFDHVRRDELLTALGLTDRPFILYPAITYPHKNHITLVAAFARLSETRPDLRLVLTGGSGPSEDVVTATIDAYGLSPKVIRTGRIPESDLDLLYRSAAVMAFPSSYEGFGVPMLEAMSRGCPIVASRIGALPDVVADAGEFVDPLDVRGWADAVGHLIDSPDRRAELSRNGFQRSRLFSWPASAAALHDIYNEDR